MNGGAITAAAAATGVRRMTEGAGLNEAGFIFVVVEYIAEHSRAEQSRGRDLDSNRRE